MADDPELRAHREWLGYLQPVGLVVSPPALAQAQAYVNRNVAPLQAVFADQVAETKVDGKSAVQALTDLPGMLKEVFGWRDGDLVEASNAPDLEVVLPDYGDVIRPDFAVPEPQPVDGASPWQLLVVSEPLAADLDTPGVDRRGWEASPQARMERLLRETSVPAGLLCNGTSLRLVYSPRGETSGYLTFPVEPMTEVSGRPILAALEMLLGSERLFNLPREQRLPGLLAASRRYQNEVSVKLAGQVLGALYELLRGLQSADNQTGGKLLADVLEEEPNQVYAALLTVLLRLVFLLFAEDRGLMPADDVYTQHYSVGALFERLRADAGQHPDTMDQRYGAWAHLLSLSRLMYDGAIHGRLRLPARHGHLFNPDRYAFLEGRPWHSNRTIGQRIDAPLISDGVVYRVLRSLVVLGGERLSYRSLDVEQIGSVYETIMGFGLGVSEGPSIALRPAQVHGAPVVVDVSALLAVTPSGRGRWVQETTGRALTPRESTALANADSVDTAVSALETKVDRRATPDVVPPGAMVLQPSEERRRSGSHYTPRSLTEPIVRLTLEPILAALGANPTPEAILEIKILDPAMGSGAFLVEACRQLGEALADAWHQHEEVPAIAPDEDELLHARRVVAQRCLYGVDRNPVATDLAKLSLWLATLARDHPFTFVDHALRCGDSLVGLSRDQIAVFDWAPAGQVDLAGAVITAGMTEAASLRIRIREAGDAPEGSLRLMLRDAEEALDDARLVGDLVIATFFSGSSARERRTLRNEMAERVTEALTVGGLHELRGVQEELRQGKLELIPFHWEIEFPEVFGRKRPGFDAIVGNPPFAGKNQLAASNPPGYPDWLKQLHSKSHGNADEVAHFYRRAFDLLRADGCFGLIATNTIGQGDTRGTGLRWIRQHGGTIYAARRRIRWPGQAAVVVSVVHVCRGPVMPPLDLDGELAPVITAYLFHAGGDDDPARLRTNSGKSFEGSKVYGMGFTFDDTDRKGIASPLAVMSHLVRDDPRNAERIFPYIGGEELNRSPRQSPHRYVIDFGNMTEAEARRWPDLMRIVQERVRPARAVDASENNRRYWWRFERRRPDLYGAVAGLKRVLAVSGAATPHLGFAFLPGGMVYANTLTLFALDSYAWFASMQARPHDIWAWFFGSTLEDRLRYGSSDCFETYPMQEAVESNRALEDAGAAYYEFRSQLMLQNSEGLTKTYNRFHDPTETSDGIAHLRRLHDELDRAVLDGYGWGDLTTTCEFILEYDEAPVDSAAGSRRRPPWRYRWSNDVRDELLSRLLELNRERAATETLAEGGRQRAGGRTRSTRGLRTTPARIAVQPDLLEDV